jgi:predicted DNA-binding transcriptional regulator YafY
MPTSDALTKTDRLHELCLLFWRNPGLRLRTPEIAHRLGVSEDTALRYIYELANGRLPLDKEGQFWQMAQDAQLELPGIRLTFPEATALFIAGRLLSQVHDEQNDHVIRALLKVVGVMPPSLAAYQHQVVEVARQRQQQQPDRSQIFEALALGWATRSKVRLRYAPPQRKAFEATFCPYLFEPSGFGRSIYVIGLSSPPGSLRTFKLERIEYAELLKKEPFEVPTDFNGPALLKHAWGVMYGEENLIKVRLRFHPMVAKRVKETLWHPSQEIIDTPEGCELVLSIADTTEIRPWIRGWGADCEVLEPVDLREEMKTEAVRLTRLYEIEPGGRSGSGINQSLFEDLFGEEEAR